MTLAVLRSWGGVCTALLLAGAGAVAQSAGPPPLRVGSAPYTLPPLLIQAQTNLVPLEVVVRNSNGRVIPNLERGNFRVLDDGNAQSLTQFFVVRSRRPAPAAADNLKKSPVTGVAKRSAPEAVAAPPRYVALFFDDINTVSSDLLHARNAALDYLRHGRGTGDRVGLFTASGGEAVPFTEDTAALTLAIAAVRAHPRAGEHGISGCLRITPFEAYQIVELRFPPAIKAANAMAAACNLLMSSKLQLGPVKEGPGGGPSVSPVAKSAAEEVVFSKAQATWDHTRAVSQDTQADIANVVAALAHEPGKRILLLASGGFLSDTLQGGQEKIIQLALHNNVVINALDARGLYLEAPSLNFDEEDNWALPLPEFFYNQVNQSAADEAKTDAMVNLAQSTGGLFFHNSNDLALGFRRLGLAPAVAYDLAFSPTAMPHDGKFHTLKVELTPRIKGAIVQVRRGYFDPAPQSEAAGLDQALNDAMRGQALPAAVPASVRVLPQPQGVGVDVKVNVARLPFVSQGGRRRQLLIMIAGLFAPDGRFVAGRRGTLDMALGSAAYKRYRARGLGATFHLAAPAGTYRLRVAVGEASNGKLSAFSLPVTVQ